MKKFTLFFLVIACFVFNAYSQAYKYPFFEHFTQASCGPCAAQNPGFQNSILDPNPTVVRHIAYHTSWPGVDPMYTYNTTQSNERVNYYGVSGVPDIFLEGNFKEAQPGGMTMSDVNTIVAQTSPIKINVSDIDNGNTHDVTVTVSSIGIPPTGSFVLLTAIIERNVTYATPPGNNGETYFPNVFRKMLPSTSGDPITLPAQGSSVTFNYTYAEDAVWDMAEIGVVSFVQKSTKEIINCGSSFDDVVNASIDAPSILALQGTSGTESDFNFFTGNTGNASEDFVYTLTSDAPGDWSASFTVNGTIYSNVATVTIPSGTSYNTSIAVTPGATPAFSQYTLSITSVANPNAPAMLVNVFVISGITDLIINSGGGIGDGSGGTAADWQDVFSNGLSFAGSNSYTIAEFNKSIQGFKDNALGGVKCIYYNVGWTFPAYTDELIGYFENFLDNKGSLFISGQDAGWDAFTPASGNGHSTAAQIDFYHNYLYTDWLEDGGVENDSLTANTLDIYSAFAAAKINNYYGGAYFYPDLLDVLGSCVPIFYYSNTTRIAGTRYTNGIYKTVYLGPGLEMVGTAADKNSLMKTTYDWFHNITGVENVNGSSETVGNNYPNPSDDVTYIPLSGLKEPATFALINTLGQVVLMEEVNAGTSLLKLNTAELPQGIYHYFLLENGKNTSHALLVVH